MDQVVVVQDPARRHRHLLLLQIWLAYRQWVTLTIKRKRHSPRVWVKNYLTYRNRHGLCWTLLPTLWDNHYGQAAIFRRTLGVDAPMFDFICAHLVPFIERTSTNYREPISIEARVSVTLYYLCTGAFYKIPSTSFIISIPMISKIVSETCHAIMEVWGDGVTKHRATMASYKWPEFSTYIGCNRWEAHNYASRNPASREVSFTIIRNTFQ